VRTRLAVVVWGGRSAMTALTRLGGMVVSSLGRVAQTNQSFAR
jgi:hypothetical protein